MKNWTNQLLLAWHRLFVVGSVAASLCNLPVAAAIELRQVVVSGQPAPGLPNGFLISGSLNNFRLNAAGEVGFTSYASREGSSSRLGVWAERNGQISPIAIEGNPAPMFGNIDSAFISELNGRGDVAVRGRLQNVAFDADDGYWLYGQSEQAVIFRENMTVPVFDGSALGYTLLGIKTNEESDSVVWASYNRAGTYGTGLWLHRDGSLRNLISENMPAPGVAGSATFVSGGAFDLSDSGHVAAKGFLIGSSVDASNDSGLWTTRNATLELLVREGDAAPGLSGGAVFANFDPPAINDDGAVAFRADTRTQSITRIGAGIWIDRHGTVEPIAVSNDLAAGVAPSGRFNRFEAPALNRQGHSAFVASIFGSGISSDRDTGLWSDGLGVRTLVAREGYAAVGAGEAVFDRFFQYGINNLGQVSFLASVRGLGIDGSNDLGLWVQDRIGILHLVAREGDSIKLPSGDFASILSLSAAINDTDAGPNLRTLNDAGFASFSARLDDRTERLFVTNIGAVPEPTSAALLLCCTGATATSVRYGARHRAGSTRR